MKNLTMLLLIAFSTQISAQTVPAFHNVNANRLLIIYNENAADENNNGMSDSKELALYYMDKRNVPDSNILGLDITTTNYYYYNNQWTNFWDEMVIPIRNKISILGDTGIYYLLLCDKIPYKLVLPVSTNTGRSLDNALVCLNHLGSSSLPNFPTYYNSNPFYESSPTNYSDKGSFDHTYNFSGTKMYLVSRLIGTDVRMNKNLIDMALYGEKYIYFDPDPEYYNGVAYADHRFGLYDDSTLQAGYHYSPTTYGDFDKDAAYIKFYYEEAGLTYKQEPNETEIGQASAVFTDGSPADSAVQAILYGGWYNYNNYHDAWEWLPGSYANDLNSNSGANIRNGGGTFLSGSFANGLTCGTGCIGEPYLNGHSQPDIFMHYFLKGYNFVEAAYHAEPKVKWQGIVVGDPLYNPYKAGKVPAKDTIIETTQISFHFESNSETHILVDYLTSEENPELIKAKLLWGNSTVYSDTINFEDIFFAHHRFELTGLNDSSTYHFAVCVKDPMGNNWCSGDETFNTTGVSSLINAAFVAENSVICDSGTVQLTNISSGNNTYQWLIDGVLFDTIASTDISLNSAGSYEISLIADNSETTDTATQFITVSSPLPVIAQFNDSLVCEAFVSWQWYFNGATIPGATMPYFIANASGDYSVLVINEYGCEAFSDIVPVTLVSFEEEILLTNTLRIYPNPAKDYIRLEYFNARPVKTVITISDVHGRMFKRILSGNSESGLQSVRINLDEITTSGIYILSLQIGKTSYRKRIMLIK
ncbi:MAG: TIGR03790 family protein [Bacteroidota bacterium]|nr:TIGR03790 family protein [Bacteroidota bacterium]